VSGGVVSGEWLATRKAKRVVKVPAIHHSRLITHQILSMQSVRTRLAQFCREPLVHFLLIGAALFVLWRFLGDQRGTQPEAVVITPGQVERLAQQWTKTHLRPPSAEELTGLVDQEVDEEILYREAVAMGLDRDDAVVRRRLAVKIDFLTDDMAAAANPTEEELQTYLQQHAGKFNVEGLISFSQIYINRSQRGNAADGEATRLLAIVNGKSGTTWQSLSDALPLPTDFRAANSAEISRHFGRDFPAKLAGLPVGGWSGPIESRYGLHLIRVHERTPGRTPPLQEVREAVANQWRITKREELNAAAQRRRRARYAVTIQWPDWAKESDVASTQANAAKESR
jgi:hypothetical protein